jgi:hypothetical protein
MIFILPLHFKTEFIDGNLNKFVNELFYEEFYFLGERSEFNWQFLPSEYSYRPPIFLKFLCPLK